MLKINEPGISESMHNLLRFGSIGIFFMMAISEWAAVMKRVRAMLGR